jgi:hypothetical protein
VVPCTIYGLRCTKSKVTFGKITKTFGEIINIW